MTAKCLERNQNLPRKHWQKSARTGPWPGSFHVYHVIMCIWHSSLVLVKEGKPGSRRCHEQLSLTTVNNTQLQLHVYKLNPSGWSFQPAYKPITKSSAQSGWKDSVSDFLSVKGTFRSCTISHPRPSLKLILRSINPRYGSILSSH